MKSLSKLVPQNDMENFIIIFKTTYVQTILSSTWEVSILRNNSELEV